MPVKASNSDLVEGWRDQGFEIGVGCGVLGFEFRVSGVGFWVLGFGFQVSGFSFRGSGFGVRV